MTDETQTVEEVQIVWRDCERETLRTPVEQWDISHGVLSIRLTEDNLPPGYQYKWLHFPLDLIDSVQTTAREVKNIGYREDSTFRESPEKSPHFRAMGNPPS